MGNNPPKNNEQKKEVIQRTDSLNQTIKVQEIKQPIKKEDPEMDPIEYQVKYAFDELNKCIIQLDKEIDATMNELRKKQSS